MKIFLSASLLCMSLSLIASNQPPASTSAMAASIQSFRLPDIINNASDEDEALVGVKLRYSHLTAGVTKLSALDQFDDEEDLSCSTSEVDEQNGAGQTAIECAVKHNFKKVIGFLLKFRDSRVSGKGLIWHSLIRLRFGIAKLLIKRVIFESLVDAMVAELHGRLDEVLIDKEDLGKEAGGDEPGGGE